MNGIKEQAQENRFFIAVYYIKDYNCIRFGVNSGGKLWI